MVKFKKSIAKAMVFAMAMGAAGVHGLGAVKPAVALATEAGGGTGTGGGAASTDPTPDYASYSIEIAVGGEKAYMVLEVLKDKTGTKVSNTYYYPISAANDDGKITVDLSFLKATKEQYIRIYGVTAGKDENTAIIPVKAQPTKINIKYDAVKGTFVDGKTKQPVTALNTYDYKGLYSSEWVVDDDDNDGLGSFDINVAKIAGTTIVVRKAAVASGDTAGPASAEIKVKVAAIAKAPKVTVDYVKGTVKLPKGAEAVIAGSDGSIDDTKFTGVEGSFSPVELLQELDKTTYASDAAAETALTTGDIKIAVRTAKTDKKAASAATLITLNTTPTLDNSDTSGTGTGTGTVTVKVAGTAVTPAQTLAFASKKDGELQLTATGADFEYSTDGNKWKKAQAGIPVTISGLKDGAKVKVRTVAVKENTKADPVVAGVFAAKAIEIVYKAPATGTPTPTPTE